MKKLSYFLLVFSICGIFYSSAQTTQGIIKKKELLVNLGFQGVELGGAFKVIDQTLLNLSFGLGLGMSLDDNSPILTLPFKDFSPYFKGNYHVVYSNDTELNSYNFFGFQSKYSLGNKDDTNFNRVILNELHWGIQRIIWTDISFNCHIGIGHMHDYNSRKNRVIPTLGISLTGHFDF